MKKLRQSATGLRRAEAYAARNDKRAWVMERRERTRHLIELGGLIQKAGLVQLTADDRATILGGLLALSDMLVGEDGKSHADLWRRRGLRAFEADRQSE